jgi:hypothetical protein
MRNKAKSMRFACGLVFATLLASCGGGGDTAGGSEDFFTNPKETVWTTSGAGSCKLGGGAGAQTRVSIVGGQPPYRIRNPYPQGLSIDRETVDGRDPEFVVTTRGGCMTEVSILVLDYHSRSTTYSVTVEAEDEETTSAATSE